MKEKWYSIREAAAYLEIGEPTIYRWMRDGRITFRKVGDSTRFLREDLDAVVEVHRAERSGEEVKKHCPYCNGEELVPGRLRSTGLLYFQLKKSKFWTLSENALKTDALMCARCGAMILFGDLTKLKKLKETPREEEK